ncbi:MAG: HEAT repeat domain-containing protein [Candidatus Pacebacteria bacterium]|nr:HEAT repeat domain-containing protein [Candidatus Paceibacterota bacterium]
MSTFWIHWLSSAVILAMFVEMPFLVAADSALGTESMTSDATSGSHSRQIGAYLDGSISARLSLRQAGLDAWPVIRTRWDEADDATRWTLMALEMPTGWGACIPSEVAHPYAVASIANDDQQIRRAAIRYVGQHAIEGARDALLTRLDDELPMLRWDILDALTNIGGDA